jgi:putative DNA primase/helicase
MASMTNAMMECGITPPSTFVYDGKIQRFKNEGDTKANSWYVGFQDGDFESGAFGCWKLDVHEDYCNRDKTSFTPEEKKAFAIKQEEIRQLKAKEKKEKHQKAEKGVNERWSKTDLVDSHQYLSDKGIKSYNLKIENDNLLVPIFNADGELVNLQTISPNGDKYFAKGGKIEGCFFLIGDVDEHLIIVEGYSTGASIYEATKLGVVVSFNAGNLLPVAKEMTSIYPHASIIVAGDDDQYNEVNTGLIKASETAKHVGGFVCFPHFEGLNKSQRFTDFNDLHQTMGLHEVKKQIYKAIHSNARTPQHESVIFYGSFFKAMKHLDGDELRECFDASIYRLMKKGKFPKQIKLAERSSGWFIEEIYNWLKNKGNARND